MSEEVIENATKTKKKRQKAEDFIGRESPDGKLEVIGIHQESVNRKPATFKVSCTECSKDSELFPDGYFVSTKGDLVRGKKPCGCSTKPEWKDWQYLILARRAGEGRFLVQGFAENFHGQHTKLNLKCVVDEYVWSANINNIINNGNGCVKCAGTYKPTEQEALEKCDAICQEMNYEVIGFVGSYINANSRFKYKCPKHGEKEVSYRSFINQGSRCRDCWKESGNGNGYYPERKDEIDFLYILNFNDQFIKVGRSFDVDERIKDLRKPTQSGISNIIKLRIFTATHQEIYDFEQGIHKELRGRGFQYYVDWSTECFENESLCILNNLLDTSELNMLH